MHDQRIGLQLRQAIRIRGHLWHSYSTNQVKWRP